MSSSKKIRDRLPDFYKSWDEGSVLYRMIGAIGSDIDGTKSGIIEMMRTHWVDVALNGDLDRIGSLFRLERASGEDDASYRARLKRAIVDFTGGGTLASIRSRLDDLFGPHYAITENPSAEGRYEIRVMSGDTWSFRSESVQEITTPEIIIEAEDIIENPEIINNLGDSLSFKGKLQKGNRLLVSEGRNRLDEVDVKNELLMNRVPRLHRRATTWRYTELIREKIGIFDDTMFDESIFAVGIPKAKITFTWTRYRPATLKVQIKEEALSRGGRSEEHVQEVLESMKAVGVDVIVEVRGDVDAKI